MTTLRRTESVDSFDMICQDTVKAISELRRDGLVGTLDSDPLLAFHLPRVEIGIRAVTLAEASQRHQQEQNDPSLFGLLAGFFSPKFKEVMTNENLKRRGMRDLQDARKTITGAARGRERILAVCQYAFGEVYVQCLYERSRLLRYLSLRVMSNSGLFSVYHQRRKAEEIMRALDRAGRDTFLRLKSRLGASPESQDVTNRLMELLNETIIVNRDAQYDKAVNQIIKIAEKAVARYEEFMHLEKSHIASNDSHSRSLDAFMLSWQEALRDYHLPAGDSGMDLRGSYLVSLHFVWLRRLFADDDIYLPPFHQNGDECASLREKALRDLNLSVLFKEAPGSAGIRRIGRVKGSFGSIDKYLLEEPFPSVSWPVSELAVKTVRVEFGASRNEETTRRLYKRLVRELRVWSKMQNARIVPILGVWDTQEQDAAFCTVSPWISNDQLDHFVITVRPKKLEALALMCDVASGLDYMHNLGSGIVHGDLKPDNILVKDGRAFITDFGLSHTMDGTRGLTSEVHGNPAWLAPEAIAAKCEKGFSKQTFKPTFAQDIYSFGCLFFFVMTREMPFERFGDSPESVLTARKEYPYENPISMNDASRLDIDYCFLMLECWRVDPALRITARLALVHIEKLVDLEKPGRPRKAASCLMASEVPLAPSNDGNKTQRPNNISRRHPTQDLLTKSRPSVSQSTELVFALLPWKMKEIDLST
ncbi:hypothetical protein ACEPAG_3954 [Sanghuangporus baumii]